MIMMAEVWNIVTFVILSDIFMLFTDIRQGNQTLRLYFEM